MKCLKCGKEYDDELEACPICNQEDDIISDMDLPQLKSDNLMDGSNVEVELPDDSSLDMDKTISITSIDNDKDDNLSLIDDINKQIDNVNEEVEQKEELQNDNKMLLNSFDSIKKRRKILLVTVSIFLAVSVAIIVFLVFSNHNSDNKVIEDYTAEYEKALDNYYNTLEIDDVIYVLESVKKDDEKVKELQSKTRTTFDSWILLYIKEEANNLDEYDDVTDRYKELLNGLHTYAIVKYDDKYIMALTDYDYEELNTQIEDIYSDCIVFFEALSYYNSKDYDKSYYMFDVIDEKNSYYERSQSYKSKIINNILTLMKNDIDKLSANIDDLTDEEKLSVYISIEEIILGYNNLYSNVQLSDNLEYQELLNSYTSKVSEYNDIVSGSVSNDEDNEDEMINESGDLQIDSRGLTLYGVYD